MSTINRELANELLKGNGKSKHGSAGYCLVRYQNRTKYDIPGVDLYDPDAKINCFDYAIFPNKRKYEEFMESDMVGGVDILWSSERFKKDEMKREQDAERDELMEGVSDIVLSYEDIEQAMPSRKER